MKDDAVSPVVGVMLLISITVIIAGILAAFAGGMTGDNIQSPSTDISAKFIGSGNNISLRLSHDGGDYLTLKDIKISAFVRTGDENAGGNSTVISEVSSLNSWGAGDIITLTPEDTRTLLGLDALKIKSAASISTPVTIRIYHIPSSEIISQVSVLLEES
jgi:FlaG/FlaF family flagellin (archaellin)